MTSIDERSTPNWLGRAWEFWKRVASALGEVVGRFVLTGFYFVVVPVFALITRVFLDPLQIKPVQGETFWLSRSEQRDTLDTLGRQF